MNRRRLAAEEIRDSILAVSGSLDPENGRSRLLPVQAGKDRRIHRTTSTTSLIRLIRASHRRSIYRFIVRSQPDPYMTTLDCADSSQSTPRRIETLTSLQALSLLNNRFNLEMAERFAERLESEANDLPEQIDRAMLLIAGRSAKRLQNETTWLAYARAAWIAEHCAECCLT